MKKSDIDCFEMLSGQLTSIYQELALLSKQNADDAVNKFKLRFINNLILESNAFLPETYRPFKDFKSFNEEALPGNGDVVFILSKYLQCFEKLRADNVMMKRGSWSWVVE